MSADDSEGQRLLRLEEKVAYQDKAIAELNDVIVELNRGLSELSRRVQAVERMAQIELGEREMPNEKPPHY
jgi:uncharacterized coiled-coil protein SlyX